MYETSVSVRDESPLHFLHVTHGWDELTDPAKSGLKWEVQHAWWLAKRDQWG